MLDKERTPALWGDRGSDNVLAWRRDNSEISENHTTFQCLGDVAARVVDQLARQHGLTRLHAKTVCVLAGMGVVE